MRRRRRYNWSRIALIVLLAAVVGGLGLRWKARKEALAYGHLVQNLLFMEEQAARVEGRVRKFDLFADAEINESAKRVEADWNPLGADYRARARELREAVVFLQRQFDLPSAERFRKMPDFRHFRIQTEDKTDVALRASLRTVVDDYTDYVGTR